MTQYLGNLDKPEERLVKAMGKLLTSYEIGKCHFARHLERLAGMRSSFKYHGTPDELHRFKKQHTTADVAMVGGNRSPIDELVRRPEHGIIDPVFHLG